MRPCRHPRLYAITALAAVTLAGCTRKTPDDTLVMVIESAVAAPDPRFTQSNWDGKVSKLVYAGLTAVDTKSQEPRLELAQALTSVDPLTWDVELRPDAKFSDGLPVLAADVAYSYESMLSPDSKSPYHKSWLERFSSVEAVGARTVRFHLKEPLATLWSDLDAGIVSPAGKGAGPFVIDELDDLHVALSANPYYFGAKPRTAHVDIKFIRDASARLLMLVGGSADLLQNAVRLDLLDDVRTRPGVRIDAAPSVILTYLMLNNTDPILKDVRVRQAIALALDRPAIVAAKFGGRAVLATGLLPPGHWAYNPDVAKWDRDLTRARALLDAAGYPDPDGAGPRPRLSLIYKTSSDAFRVSVARVIAAQLAEVGIDVDVRPFEFATFFSDVKRGNYQLASMQSAEINEPDYYYNYFHSSRIPTADNPDGADRWRYANADVDRWTAAGRHELDRAKRKDLYAKVQVQLAQDVPIIPLWHEDNVVVSNASVQGYEITPNARLKGLVTAWKQP